MALKIGVDSLKPIKVNRRGQLSFIIRFLWFGLFLLCGCAPEMRQVQYEEDPGQVAVRLVYVDAQARTVCLSGSFNNWSEDSHCMKPIFDVWSIELSLPPGRHEYQFVVDGLIRRDDPRNVLAEDNGFGMKNSILFVE
jgi:hypothetical protein